MRMGKNGYVTAEALVRICAALICTKDGIMKIVPDKSYLLNTYKVTIILFLKERILAIKLLEKQARDPEYAKRIGIPVSMVKTDTKITEVKNV